MIAGLLKRLEGYKTYATAGLTLVVCGLLYLSGADVQTLAFVAIAGLCGSQASLRQAVARGKVTKEELAVEVLKVLEPKPEELADVAQDS